MAAKTEASSDVIAALIKKYPNRAEDIAKGAIADGPPLVSEIKKLVTIKETSQSWVLRDGTILPLSVDTVS
jgi:hypothetical protein